MEGIYLQDPTTIPLVSEFFRDLENLEFNYKIFGLGFRVFGFIGVSSASHSLRLEGSSQVI